MSAARLLIIDASLNKRMATELRRRNKNAKSLSELKAAEAKDPLLLRFLHMHCGDGWVLVTYDDHLPEEHALLIERWLPTIAIIDPLRDPGYGEDAWQFDVAHRWAHKMEQQQAHTIVRYGRGHAIWTRPRSPRLLS